MKIALFLILLDSFHHGIMMIIHIAHFLGAFWLVLVHGIVKSFGLEDV